MNENKNRPFFYFGYKLSSIGHHDHDKHMNCYDDDDDDDCDKHHSNRPRQFRLVGCLVGRSLDLASYFGCFRKFGFWSLKVFLNFFLFKIITTNLLYHHHHHYHHYHLNDNDDDDNDYDLAIIFLNCFYHPRIFLHLLWIWRLLFYGCFFSRLLLCSISTGPVCSSFFFCFFSVNFGLN